MEMREIKQLLLCEKKKTKKIRKKQTVMEEIEVWDQETKKKEITRTETKKNWNENKLQARKIASSPGIREMSVRM